MRYVLSMTCIAFAMAVGACKTSSKSEVSTQIEKDRPIWKTWGGNLENTHQGINSPALTTHNVGQLEAKWVFEAQGDISLIPVVSTEHVYFADWGTPLIAPLTGGSFLHALDRESGRPLWKKSVIDYSENRLNNVIRVVAIEGDLIIFGDNRGAIDSVLNIPGSHGASVYAINRQTGKLVWKTRVDDNSLSVVTQSPVIYKGKIFVGTSSLEEAAARLTKECCSFRGAMLSLDLATGKILWKTYMAPKSEEKNGFTGNAVWGSQPSIDPKRNAVYIATGNNYTFPKVLEECLKAHKGQPDKQQTECYDRFDATDNYADSVLALDLDTGAVKWARKLQNFGAWTFACDKSLAPILPARKRNCEDRESLDFDFGQAPMIVHTKIEGVTRDILAVGQKSGVFWAFDPDKMGATLWNTFVGPGGNLGGMEFGSAADDERIYAQVTNFQHQKYTVLAGPQKGTVANGGLWAALDPATGKLLWQTPDPTAKRSHKGILVHPNYGAFLGDGYFGVAKGPMTVNNGVVYAGSMDREGHMYAFDGKDGHILWSYASGGSVNSAPAIVDNVLYWGSGYGKTAFGNKKFFAFALPKN